MEEAIEEVEFRITNLLKQLENAKIRQKKAEKQLEEQKQLSVTDKALEEGSKLDLQNLPILELDRARNVVSALENLIRVEESVLMVLNLLANNQLNQLNQFNQSVMENYTHVMKENNTAEQLEKGNLLVSEYLIMNDLYSYSVIIDPTDIFYKNNNFILEKKDEFKKDEFKKDEFKKDEFKKNMFVVFRHFIHTDHTKKKYKEVDNYIENKNIFPVGILINYLNNNIYVIVNIDTQYSFLYINDFIKICVDKKLDELMATNSHNYFRKLIDNLKDCLSTAESFINQLYYNRTIQEDIKLISTIKENIQKLNDIYWKFWE